MHLTLIEIAENNENIDLWIEGSWSGVFLLLLLLPVLLHQRGTILSSDRCAQSDWPLGINENKELESEEDGTCS